MSVKKNNGYLEKIYKDIIKIAKEIDTYGEYSIEECGSKIVVKRLKDEQKIIIIERGNNLLLVTVFPFDNIGCYVNEYLKKQMTTPRNKRTQGYSDYITYGFSTCK